MSKSFLFVFGMVLLLNSGLIAEGRIIRGVPILAQQGAETGEELPEWIKGTGLVTGLLGGPVFAMWYAWFITQKRIPQMERAHREQLERMEERHINQMNLLIANFREDQRTMWAVKKEGDQKVIEALNKLADRIDNGVCGYLKRE